jgi:hypothetical protein
VAVSSGKTLHNIDFNNPKDIIIEGLKLKIDSLGDLRVPFDITTDYPSREAYEHDEVSGRVIRRRIVVKKTNNSVKRYALGQNVSGYRNDEELFDEDIQGHLDAFNMEISAWSTDSKDRDNLVELVKLWMLELEQELQSGEIELPFFYNRNLFAIKFLRAYEDINMDIYRNGPIYVGSAVFEVLVPFFHGTREELERYRIILTTRVVDFTV